MLERGGMEVKGFLKIFDPVSGEVFYDGHNAIHHENMSEALAQMVANRGTNFIYEMAFGNGGTSVDVTGVITYLPANTESQNADLYNPVFTKVVDDNSTTNLDPTRNKIEVRHVPGETYTDVLVTCLLDYGEPSDQAVFDNTQTLTETYVFDELGLKGYAENESDRKLLTHVVFHPFQKALNRLVQIDYTVRISALTNLSSIS